MPIVINRRDERMSFFLFCDNLSHSLLSKNSLRFEKPKRKKMIHKRNANNWLLVSFERTIWKVKYYERPYFNTSQTNYLWISTYFETVFLDPTMQLIIITLLFQPFSGRNCFANQLLWKPFLGGSLSIFLAFNFHRQSIKWIQFENAFWSQWKSLTGVFIKPRKTHYNSHNHIWILKRIKQHRPLSESNQIMRGISLCFFFTL